MSSEIKIPVIFADQFGAASAGIFDPNDWREKSKDVIRSCCSEYAVLNYCANKISEISHNSAAYCKGNIEDAQKHWSQAKFDLNRLTFFAEKPELHVYIEAFLSGVKSLLDIIVQLISTEEIVRNNIHGFHRDQGIYGGKILNLLGNNAVKGKELMAKSIHDLISEHKNIWIDQAINARDLLIHPERGMFQLMFNLEFVERDKSLVCSKINLPTINSKPIDSYANETLGHIKGFSSNFLPLFKTQEKSS